MKGKKGVFAAFSLISQLGLSIVVPVLLCIFIGVKLDERFGTSLTVLFIVLGILAGARNAYALLRQTKNMIEDESDINE
ncbi:MAG: AtpZ/AtpI family protein [Faecalimonas sp.]|nr:AtpZ/AtpI family protein [Faecalimonas sp.]